ncbi:MAG: hypothetical protein KA368_24860, partial [Acidobacteria bacterium]|nr:hypothetical protein [Acidobacteriota bacterium]
MAVQASSKNGKAEKKVLAFYKDDPREVPAYALPQAARCLKIPVGTLKTWVKGREYPVDGGSKRKFFKPVILLPNQRIQRLSFMNLVEAHVLNGIRRIENIPFRKVRQAIEYLEKKYPSKHPLADRLFQTDGVDLLIEDLGKLINVSRHGQIEMREIVDKYLRRIDRDPAKHLPIRLYPFLRSTHQAEEPLSVVIDPLVSFGQPTLVKTGIPTAVIA